jgi:hypothetical protein
MAEGWYKQYILGLQVEYHVYFIDWQPSTARISHFVNTTLAHVTKGADPLG